MVTMAYFAELDENNNVKRVISINNSVINEPDFSFPDTEPLGRLYISKTLGLSGNWKQTSINGSFRGRYAGENFYYDAEKDEFLPPKE